MNSKKKVFISGPMTGIENLNKDEFDRAAKFLSNVGYFAFNPWKLYEMMGNSLSNEEYEAIDMAALAQCDAIYLLDGWVNSVGARIEYDYAITNGYDILTETTVMEKLWNEINN